MREGTGEAEKTLETLRVTERVRERMRERERNGQEKQIHSHSFSGMK